MTVWFFHGKEDYKINKEIAKLKKELLDDAFKSMNFRIYYSPSPENLIDICSTAPLMFGNIISLIHCEGYFFKKKNRKVDFSDAQIAAVENAMKNIADSNTLIFVCNVPRDENKKVDARSKLFKTIAHFSNIKEFEQYRIFDKEFASYVSTMIKEKELTADSKTVTHLTQRLGVNLQLIDTELEKLKTAVYPKKKITPQDIDTYCVLTEDVFALADLAAGNDKNAVMKQFSAVIEKSHSLEVIALLHTNLRKLLYIKTFEKEKSLRAISEDLKMPEYPVKLLAERIKNISFENLTAFKRNLTDAEFKIKTGKALNAEYLLESVILGKAD